MQRLNYYKTKKYTEFIKRNVKLLKIKRTLRD